MQAYIKSTIENQVATIEFFHPAHNSMPGHLLEELVKAIQQAGENEEAKIIVLQSAGNRTFCAGASFNELIAIENEAQGLAFFSGFAKVINACRTCPKLIIGRVQGKAVGGGVGIAAAVDYCLATPYAAIKLSELNIGIGPFVIGPAVERKIGLSAMSQLSIDAANFQSAEWAKAKGLYAEIYETTEALDEAVIQLKNQLIQYNPEAMNQLKKVFWEGTENWEELLLERAKISGSLVLSSYTKERLKQYQR